MSGPIGWLNRWLEKPAESAAGRMGLFRIVYSLFYLWHLSYVEAGLLAQAPPDNWHPVYLYRYILARPPDWLPGVVEGLLVGLLILLLVGMHTRAVTVLVFVLGFLLDGFLQSFGKVEHGTIFLTFYLPLIMSFSTWGATHSIDALARAKEGSEMIRVSDRGGIHIWPMRVVLILLSFLFLTAGLSKLLVGNWISGPTLISNLFVEKYHAAILEGLTPNPFAVFVLAHPAMAGCLSLVIPLFECLFVLVLVGPRTRRIYLSLTVLFHALNAMLLVVTFTPILIAYGIAVDWEGLVRPAKRHLSRWAAPRYSPESIIPFRVYFVLFAVVAGLDWNGLGLGRHLLNLGGMLNWLTIWYLAAPVALVTLMVLASAPLRRLLAASG